MRARFASRRLFEPVVVGGLLHVRLWGDGTQRAEQLDAPGVEVVTQGAGLHPLPLDASDGTGVADQLSRQLGRHRRREELGSFDLLDHRQRLRLGPGARRVIALEGEKDH